MMYNLSENYKYMDAYLEECNKIQRKNKLECEIESLMRSSREVYWNLLRQVEKSETINKSSLGILEKASEYTAVSKGILEEYVRTNKEYIPQKQHIINRINFKGINSMNCVFPLISLSAIKNEVNNLKEVNFWKGFIAIATAIITMFFGQLYILTRTLFIMTIIHFITRCIFNKTENESQYANFSKNIQLFFWPYIELIISNAINNIVAINGLPKNTFLALCECWIIWGELKGIVENAESAGFPIPPIIKNMVLRSNDSNDNTPTFPF